MTEVINQAGWSSSRGAAWLDQVVEAPLEPALPIIDTHNHLWDPPGSRYFLDELLADTNSGHNVVATVFVECGAMYRAGGPAHLRVVGETEFINGVAAQSESGIYGPTRACAGIVSHADLSLGAAVAEVLDAHLAAAPQRFRGIRHITPSDSDAFLISLLPPMKQGLLNDTAFRQGARELIKRGMSYDGFVFQHQISEMIAFANALPDLVIIVDHLGGPLRIGQYKDKQAELFPQWKKSMSELAKCPNVNVKLGGLNMPISGFDWHLRDVPPTSEELAAAQRDYYLHAIDCFGPARCTFESNFPVDKLSCSYGVLWNSFKRIVSGFSAGDKALMFSGCARRVYRLD